MSFTSSFAQSLYESAKQTQKSPSLSSNSSQQSTTNPSKPISASSVTTIPASKPNTNTNTNLASSASAASSPAQSTAKLTGAPFTYPSPLPKTPIPATKAGDILGSSNTPTGTWSHPALPKIWARQHRHAPNDTTVRKILANTFVIILLYLVRPYFTRFLTDLKPKIHDEDEMHRSSMGSAIGMGMGVIGGMHKLEDMEKWVGYLGYLGYLGLSVFAICAWNIVENVRRFYWADAFSDIELTPRQRKLLNLPNSPAPPSNSGGLIGGKGKVTPPRYVKSFSPSPSASPLSGQPRLRRSSLANMSGGGGGGASSDTTTVLNEANEIHRAQTSSFLSGSPGFAASTMTEPDLGTNVPASPSDARRLSKSGIVKSRDNSEFAVKGRYKFQQSGSGSPSPSFVRWT